MDASIIQQKIFDIRGEKVMLDFDLAILYGVETKRLNEQVKRNLSRFPPDFMFRLTEKEWEMVQKRSDGFSPMWSQIATTSARNRKKQYLPFAFSEHGVTMLASVLRSNTAIMVNIIIVRAFIALRHVAIQYKELADKLAQLESSNNEQFKEIYEALNYLVDKKQTGEDFDNRELIGFRR
jgi:hypothetical protein